MSATTPEHLDAVLVGLALFETYQRGDTDALKVMAHTTPAGEAVGGLLAAMSLLTTMAAHELDTSPTHISASVRRRVLARLCETQGKK